MFRDSPPEINPPTPIKMPIHPLDVSFRPETAWQCIANMVRWDDTARDHFNGWLAFLGNQPPETRRFALHESGVLPRLVAVFTDAHVARHRHETRQLASAIFSLGCSVCTDASAPRALVDMGLLLVMERVCNARAQGLLRRMAFYDPEFVVSAVQANERLMRLLQNTASRAHVLQYFKREARRADSKSRSDRSGAVDLSALDHRKTRRRYASIFYRTQRRMRKMLYDAPPSLTATQRLLLDVLNGLPVGSIRDHVERCPPDDLVRHTGAQICQFMDIFDKTVNHFDRSEHWSDVRNVLLANS